MSRGNPVGCDDLADIFIAIVGVVRRCGGRVIEHERTGGDGFCWVPNEAVGFSAGVGQCAMACNA